MGFILSGFSGRCLARDFAQAPPTRFAKTIRREAACQRRRPGVSIGHHLAPLRLPVKPADASGTTLTGFLHLTESIRTNRALPGLCVHLVPALCVTANGPAIFGQALGSNGAGLDVT
jgi:hypothetical protein